MSLLIEGIKTEILPGENNLVELADRLNIQINAPCYRTQNSSQCCNKCLVKVDGVLENACISKPFHGTSVLINR